MLLTFSVADTSSVFVFNRRLTFAKDDLTLNAFLISKNVLVNAIVEIKVRSSVNSLCSIQLSCINDILIIYQCMTGTCVFYNSWKNFFFSIRDQIAFMRAGDYEQIIDYDWPNCLRHLSLYLYDICLACSHIDFEVNLKCK